jgi:3-hydroxyacyl-CoA dehydrogenase/enoyl-CoA hydratase/3-hydroxybutyryl-CoA epimerase
MTTSNPQGFHAEFDAATGVATVTMTMPGRANKVNAEFGEGLNAAFDIALAFQGVKGIVIASGHPDFCVGADLDVIYRVRDPKQVEEMTAGLNALYRKIETAKVPVVAALGGSALGGGYELALACHHRIALDSPSVQLGLPEVSLGVIPGAGGTQRLPRLIGLQAAMELIAQGKILRAPQAKKAGLVDALAPTPEALREAALAWIAANPNAKQPWDRAGFQFPGGVQPNTDMARQLFMAGAAMLVQKTAGAFKSPEAAIRAIHDGAITDFDTALKVEGAYFAERATSDQAKDMIRTFWYHRTAVEKQKGLPQVEDPGFQKIGILGAGMMGAGIAFVSAQRGYDVVIKDIKQASLDAAAEHCKKQVAEKAKHLSPQEKEALLGRIRTTLNDADLQGCDLVIEAVFENKDLKHRVTREIEPLLSPDGVWASNTSALPITDLAVASKRPENFIGLHFFSPVEAMPLVEVIVGKQTSERTLGRALAYVRAIKKTAIVVNDGYGFYTSRMFASYILEAAQLVAQGHDPVLVEWAARQAGMAVAPLKVFDEVTLSLAAHAFEGMEAYRGQSVDEPGVRLVRKLVEMGRTGKAAGAGFYDYQSKPRRLWSGLKDLAEGRPAETGVEYIARRLMLVQALNATRCLEEGILREKRDAEIGAIFGVGFAPNTGGPLAWIDRQGPAQVVAWADAIARTEGERFAVPKLLRDMAAKGETFFERV